ncbi:MAG: glycosyltransferase family 4 protein [Ruminococcaceae bacterium]|nr:glycosyltransferase family 4 protein [Oscillospiraceae bacterium]
MKMMVISPKNRTVYNFRGDLIKKAVSMGHEVIVTGPDLVDIDKIEALGAKFFEVPMNKNGLNPKEDIRYMKALEDIINSEKPDVVFCYTVKPVVYGAYIAKKCGVKKIVPMITGAGYAFISKTLKAKLVKKVVSFLYRRSLNCADDVIFQNPDDMAQFVSEKLVKKEKCVLVNGSGVNMEKFSKAPLPSKTVFFMLSRVIKSKGIREYLSAAETVKSKYPDVEFRLLGAVENIQDSLSREQLDRYIDNGIITHFGESENVVPFYHACSVFVLPSYREGTPRSVLEAMSCGRAIITTDAPGCRETVKDGVNGFLVPVRDSDSIAKKMIEFIENPSSIEKMGNASYEYCKEKFEVGKVNEKMIEILGLK